VSVAVAELHDPEDDGVVEHGAAAFLDGLQLAQEIGELLGVPLVDLGLVAV
jgi:hypothetical protein